MALEIIDRPRQKLIENANFWQLIDQQPAKFNEFQGVSYVSSVKYIEKYLLPRFEKITLILGLSDNGQNSIGQRINQLLNERQHLIEYSYAHPQSEFTQRIKDGSLRLFFTKKELIHTKLYLLLNARAYWVFSGSMNLTQAALKRNMEQLVCDYGRQTDPLYFCYEKLFADNLANSASYLDAKKLAGYLKSKNKEQLDIQILHDSTLEINNRTSQAKKDVVILAPEEIKAYRAKYSKDEEFKKLSAKQRLAVTQTVTLFGDGGHKRKKLDNIGHSLYTLTQRIRIQNKKHTDNLKINKEEDLFPKPVLFYNNGQLFQAAKIGDNLPMEAVTVDLSAEKLRQALQLFCDITTEYNTYKDVGEGWQACEFMLFLYEAPWLWKVRNLYELSDSSKSREDVPIGLALIGQGRTGKSTLGKKLAAKLTGAHNFLDSGMLDPRNYELGKSNINMTITDTLSDYLYSNGPVSPMMIDDVSPDLTTRPYFERFIKEVTNNRNLTHPLPSFIFTMNRRESSVKLQFSLKPEIMRRLWYLSFESTFCGEPAQREAALNNLFSRANDNLFKYCQIELAKFFANITDTDAQAIEEDYLYPVKHVLKTAMDRYQMYYRVKKYFATNYDYSLFVGRNDWNMLINQADIGKDIVFAKQNNRLKAQINKQLFNKVSDNTARNSGSMMMNRYFQYLPRKFHISSEQTSTGFIIDVENFDRWLDSDALMNRYQNSDAVRSKKRQDTQEQLVKAINQMTELNKNLQAEQAKKRHGWLGNLFHH